MPSSHDHTFSNIAENAEYSHSYVIDEAAYNSLVSVFGDESPIHVDEEYAQAAGFPGRVMHGAILQGFLSHFVGMHFPGRRSMILSTAVNYLRPSYLGDKLTLMVRVRQKVETGQVVVLEVRFVNELSRAIVASGKLQVSLRDDG